MRNLLIAAALVCASGAVARAQAPATDFSVATADSSLTYHLVHKMHKVDGVSRKVEGKARLAADGKAQVMVRAPSESFDSGNVNRDAHMKEAVEAAKYPWIELKALADGIKPPATFPTTEKKTWKAQLSFHGVQQVVDVPVAVTWESANRVRAAATLAISLDAYKVERPSLMFVKVDDELKIDAKLTFTR
jgi:polyisoprenoid-binding protein YceI